MVVVGTELPYFHNCGAVWFEDDCESISSGNGVFYQTLTTRV
jgi:hypothetical protein